jgi:protein-L-isoaspartate(D-aspartate) O-methyltransferase
MINFEIARENMIESQVRPNGITDSRVIAAMAAVPREPFVPESRRAVAYMDKDITVAGSGADRRVIMEPMAFARLLQLAQIGPDDFVLDVGCATGYSAAVLAYLGDSIVAIDGDEALCTEATANIEGQDISNIAVLHAAHAEGCPSQGPYDVIVIEGRVPEVPQALLEQLKDGGRLVAVVGDDICARAVLWTRHGQTFANREEFNATIAPLPGIEAETPPFSF